MKNTNTGTKIYIVLSVIGLIINALPIIFLWGNLSFTKYSIISIAFAICSVIYALIAFSNKNKGNLFVAGKFWVYRALSFTFSQNDPHTENEEYKKEFALSAFIYCITIPTYITFAFLANGFYSALSRAISWTISRHVAIIVVVLIPPIIKHIKEKKQKQLRDEADRKEQEHRESTGKWK
jgi:hypothetical protein